MEKEGRAPDTNGQPAFEHEAIAKDDENFWFGIPEIPQTERTRDFVGNKPVSRAERRIADIRFEVSEIQRIHEEEDSAIRSSGIIRASNEAIRLIDEQIRAIEERHSGHPKESFISMEHSNLLRKRKQLLENEPEFMKMHRENAAMRNARLAELHKEYLILMRAKA